MHVLFVAPYPPTALRTRSRNLIKQIARHGHRVTAVVLSVGRSEPGTTDRASRDSFELVTVNQPAVSAYLSSAGALVRNQSLEVAYCSSPMWRRAVQEFVASGNVDLVHFEHIRSTSIGADFPLPTVWDAVDCRTTVWTRARDLGHGVRRLIGAVEAPRVRRQERRQWLSTTKSLSPRLPTAKPLWRYPPALCQPSYATVWTPTTSLLCRGAPRAARSC